LFFITSLVSIHSSCGVRMNAALFDIVDLYLEIKTRRDIIETGFENRFQQYNK
jgi:hypothetical protein